MPLCIIRCTANNIYDREYKKTLSRRNRAITTSARDYNSSTRGTTGRIVFVDKSGLLHRKSRQGREMHRPGRRCHDARTGREEHRVEGRLLGAPAIPSLLAFGVQRLSHGVHNTQQ